VLHGKLRLDSVLPPHHRANPMSGRRHVRRGAEFARHHHERVLLLEHEAQLVAIDRDDLREPVTELDPTADQR
jgi:hypothetical protein